MNDESSSLLNRRQARFLIVDDEPANLKLLDKMLRAEGYEHLALVQDPREVLKTFELVGPDIILLDLNMPNLDGYAVLEALKAHARHDLPPVLVLTAQQGRDNRLRALEQGARDYLTKPFDRAELLARVRNLIEAHRLHRLVKDENEILEARVRERTRELRETRLQIVQRLGRAAEYRDNETGYHILRMSHTSALLARHLGWSFEDCELLLHASPMHDIGKIGIPDHILLKPGKLTPEEWEIMKTHATIGAHILEGDDSDVLTMAREIALSHHEKWDGTGYPRGLKGEEIPLAGRIVAMADVFDALTSERPYKQAWSVERALDYIRENRGRHFDPRIVDLFVKHLSEILVIRSRYAEPSDVRQPGGVSQT
jgi:putative two-component system response regulator